MLSADCGQRSCSMPARLAALSRNGISNARRFCPIRKSTASSWVCSNSIAWPNEDSAPELSVVRTTPSGSRTATFASGTPSKRISAISQTKSFAGSRPVVSMSSTATRSIGKRERLVGRYQSVSSISSSDSSTVVVGSAVAMESKPVAVRWKRAGKRSGSCASLSIDCVKPIDFRDSRKAAADSGPRSESVW